MPRLPAEAFRRYDETPDEEFYSIPRLVTHIDERAIEAVTQLYRELFPAGGEILDLMSSWLSHLPEEVRYERVVGLGMNEVELEKNPRLDGYVVRNLNRDPKLPFSDAEFDGVGICVSVDYLTDPSTVLREVGRVLKIGAPVVITFSNRCSLTRAVRFLLPTCLWLLPGTRNRSRSDSRRTGPGRGTCCPLRVSGRAEHQTGLEGHIRRGTARPRDPRPAWRRIARVGCCQFVQCRGRCVLATD